MLMLLGWGPHLETHCMATHGGYSLTNTDGALNPWDGHGQNIPSPPEPGVSQRSKALASLLFPIFYPASVLSWAFGSQSLQMGQKMFS